MSGWVSVAVAVAVAATLALIVVTCAGFVASFIVAERLKRWIARKLGVDYDPD